MFMTLNTSGNPGRFFPVMSPTDFNGSAVGPFIVESAVTIVNKPSTIESFRIDTQNLAVDGTEKYNFLLNGTPTGDSITVVNGTRVGETTGLAIALVDGDHIAWQNDAGASGLVGQTLVTTFLTTP